MLHVGATQFSFSRTTSLDSGKVAVWNTWRNITWPFAKRAGLAPPDDQHLQRRSGGSGLSAPDEEQVPDVSVTGVSVVSDPGADHTYGIGDTIQVRVTFNRLVVDVDTSAGTPRLKIDMDPAEWGEKWASYPAAAARQILIFTHTVVEPNISTQGIAVLAEHPGAERRDHPVLTATTPAWPTPASPTTPTTRWTGSSRRTAAMRKKAPVAAADPERSRSPRQGAVTGVSVSSTPQAAATYGNGETIQVSVTFGAPVDVDTSAGTPRLKIDMDPAEWGEKWASYASGSGTATLTFTHTVVEPNISTQGIAVLAEHPGAERRRPSGRTAPTPTCPTPASPTTPTTRWTGSRRIRIRTLTLSRSHRPTIRPRARRPSPARPGWARR